MLSVWLEDGTLNEIIDSNLIDIVKGELMEEINNIKIEIENIKKEIEALKNKGV